MAITLANGSAISVADGIIAERSKESIGVSLNRKQATTAVCYPTLKSVSLMGIVKTFAERI